MIVDNGTVQTVVWTMPGPLMASISVTLDPARTQTPEHSISLSGYARSVQRNWRNRKASSSNLGMTALPRSEPHFAAMMRRQIRTR